MLDIGRNLLTCKRRSDDLTVTNPEFIKKAIELKSCNALLLKINQIGTISEAIQAAKDAFGAGWGVMVSHRSGETEDVTISDIVVGIRAGQIVSPRPSCLVAAILIVTENWSPMPFGAAGKAQPNSSHRRRARTMPSTLARTSALLSTCEGGEMTSHDRQADWHVEKDEARVYYLQTELSSKRKVVVPIALGRKI